MRQLDSQIKAPDLAELQMVFERTHFAPGAEPRVYTSNLCDLAGAKHDQGPGILKYDPQMLAASDGEMPMEGDIVFCICPCHRKTQA